MQTWTQKRVQMWMQNWKKMWVSMTGTRYCTTKVDVIKNTKKYANLDARQYAIRDSKVDANMGEIAETKLDEKYGCNGSRCKR